MLVQGFEPDLRSPAAAIMVQRSAPRDDELRLGDAADLRRLPTRLRVQVAEMVVARRPVGAASSRLDARRICERARSQAPVLSAYLDCRAESGPLVVSWSGAPPAPQPKATPCATIMRPVRAGEAVRLADLEPTSCTARPGAFRYDPAARLARASRDLGIGDQVRPPPVGALAEIQAGQPLYIATRIGPVSVERRVHALRDAPQGAQVVVRADDGTVFLAPRPAP